jgi:uncharacterized protein RhaS with RHS repeats
VKLAGGLNQYQYVPNPTGWVDPLGLADCPGGDGCKPQHDEKNPTDKTKVDDGDAAPPKISIDIPEMGYHKEVYANKPIKPQDATNEWERFLGAGPYTDIHPRTGKSDSDRIVSTDGTKSIRYGAHEMNSKPNKHHYHEETWRFNLKRTAVDVDNTVVRIPQGNIKK